jgi:LPS-assembly protein
MIFNYDQLFRTNRFSGFDRIADANHITYALTSRWLSNESGQEKMSVSVGQIRYFEDRRVTLCYNNNGTCVDNPLTLGYTSPEEKTSPIASRAMYHISPSWVVSGDYVWDVYSESTNNANVNFHYQPALNHIISFGYSFLGNGNLLRQGNSLIQNNPLNQATVAYAWPLTEHWSSLGAYSYNISERYDMMAFMGLQYDSCCWALRLMGGRVFKSLSQDTLLVPEYNNSVYVQVLLKGLGSVANADPATTIRSYLPDYQNMF